MLKYKDKLINSSISNHSINCYNQFSNCKKLIFEINYKD